MKNLLLSLFILVSLNLYAQDNAGIPIFHRLLIYNQNNEVLIVKIKNTEYWLTPGIYQDDKLYLKEGLWTLANAYGLEISQPELHAVFMLKYANDTKLSIRNIFVSQTKDGVNKRPEFVSEVKWVSLKEAKKMLSFPHIIAMVNQVSSYPKTIWGGTLSNYKEDETFKCKILEDFYPLYESQKAAKKRMKKSLLKEKA